MPPLTSLSHEKKASETDNMEDEPGAEAHPDQLEVPFFVSLCSPFRPALALHLGKGSCSR
jgi:hypothetical protein